MIELDFFCHSDQNQWPIFWIARVGQQGYYSDSRVLMCLMEGEVLGDILMSLLEISEKN